MKELIIHFIGLALFSTAVPNEQGVRVLLPRVAHEHTTTATDPPVYQSGSEEDIEHIDDPYTREVEEHKTFIVYDESDFRKEVNWPSFELPAHMIRAKTVNPARYRYVPLGDGERVSFHTFMTDSTRLSMPALPKPSCGSAIDPANAAAIVHIPQGVMSACTAASGTKRRYDTTLTLKRDDQYGLSIVATARDGTMKVVTVGGTKPVYVVNVPASMLTDADYAPSGGAHYLAYYDLVRLDTDTCATQSFKAPSLAKSTTCPVTDLALTGDSTVSTYAMVMDSNCSNSTWP